MIVTEEVEQRRVHVVDVVRPEVPLRMLTGAILHRLLLERRAPSIRWLEDVVAILVAGVAPRPAAAEFA